MPKECRDTEKLSKVVYNKNLEYKIIGKDSPGPGVYNQTALNIWNQTPYAEMHRKPSITIPKSKRHLSNVYKDARIGPNTYQDIKKIDQFYNSTSKRISIGRETRNFDPIRYATQHSILQVKGIY